MDEVVGELNDHSHPTSETKREVLHVKNRIKHKAQDTGQQILAAELQGIFETASKFAKCGTPSKNHSITKTWAKLITQSSK